MAIKVGFVSLGCPKNLINTEVMLAKLVDKGVEIVAEDIDGHDRKNKEDKHEPATLYRHLDEGEVHFLR